MDSSSTWSTSDELAYLSGIGTHGVRPDLANRADLLKGYEHALKYRVNSAKYLDMERIRERLYELMNGGEEYGS